MKKYHNISAYIDSMRKVIYKQGGLHIPKNRKCFLYMACLLLLFSIAFITPKTVTDIRTTVAIRNKELPIYCVGTDKKLVALSFDASWGNENTQKILDILEKNNVKVTFFATGGWVKEYPEDVKNIIAAGHAFGNHSQNHKFMSKLSAEEQKEEIMSVHNQVKELTGYDMCVFRPPYGDYNDLLINTLGECGYYAIQWSVDSLDWKDYDADTLVDKITKHKSMENGAIVLMHNAGKHTPEALERIISTLREQGYEFATIPELIYTDNYHIDHTGKQIKD